MGSTEKLISIFQIVNDWLKFAETKNAVLLAFSGAAITAIVTYLSAASSTPRSLQIGLLSSVFLFCISSLVCAASFLPKTDLEKLVWLREKPSRKSAYSLKETDNFYHCNDLRKYSSIELLTSINKLYFEDQIKLPYKKEDLDLANQIIINSEIASIKFRFFVIALWSLIFSFLVIPLSLGSALIAYRSL
jgi:hypothetical protein